MTTSAPITVGEKRRFKLAKTRGRPFVGTVARKAGVFTIFTVKDGSEVRVRNSLVGAVYTFKPYDTAKRRAAAAETAEA